MQASRNYPMGTIYNGCWLGKNGRRRTANGWRRHAGGFIAGLSRQDKRNGQLNRHDPGAIRRETGPGRMIEPGMVVEQRVGGIAGQQSQLVVEQHCRQRHRQDQISQ